MVFLQVVLFQEPWRYFCNKALRIALPQEASNQIARGVPPGKNLDVHCRDAKMFLQARQGRDEGPWTHSTSLA